MTYVMLLPRFGNVFPNDIIKRLQDLEQSINAFGSGTSGGVGSGISSAAPNDMLTGDKIVRLQRYGAPAGVTLRSANGTFGVPTALGVGDYLGVYGFNGYNGTSWSTTGSPHITSQAAEAWTPTAQGADVSVATRPIGTVTAVQSGIWTEYGDYQVPRGNVLISPTTDQTGVLVNQQGTQLLINVDHTFDYLPGDNSQKPYTSVNVGGLINYPRAHVELEGTWTGKTNVSTLFGINPAFQHAVAYRNDPAVAATMGGTQGFNHVPWYIADSQSIKWHDPLVNFNHPGQGVNWHIGLSDGAVWTTLTGGLYDQINILGAYSYGFALAGTHVNNRYGYLANDLGGQSPVSTYNGSTAGHFADVTLISADTLVFASNGQFPTAGTVRVYTDTDQASFSYTGKSGSTSLTGVTYVSGAGALYVGAPAKLAGHFSTTYTGSNVAIGSIGSSLTFASTCGMATAGTVTVITSTGIGTFTYTGRSSDNVTLTGCTYVAGSGTLTTGANVTAGAGVVDRQIGLVVGHLESDGVTLSPLSSGVLNDAAWLAGTVQAYPSDARFSAAPWANGWVGFPATYTLDFASANLGSVYSFGGNVVLNQSALAVGLVNVFSHEATYQNANPLGTAGTGIVANLGPAITMFATPHFVADGAAISAGAQTGIISGPTFGVENSGTLTVPSVTGYSSIIHVNTGATVTTRYGFRILDVSGTAAASAIAAQYGFYVPYLTGAATNIGMSLGSAFATPAPPARTVVATSKILPDAAYIVLSGGTGTTAIVLGSATIVCIAPGYVDGQRVRILNKNTAPIRYTNGRGVNLGGNATVNQAKNSLLEFHWSSDAVTWILVGGPTSSGGSAVGNIAATAPGTWGPSGFLSSTGSTTITPPSPAPLYGTGAPLINFAPYLRYAGSGALGSHAVVANGSILSNDGVTAGITLRTAQVILDNQTIRADTRTDVAGSPYYTVRSVPVVDSIGGGLFSTAPTIWAGYSGANIRTAAGNRWGWYFANATILSSTTTNTLNAGTLSAIDGGTQHLTGPAGSFGSADSNNPVLDAAGIIPYTTSNHADNLNSAAFLGGTGVLTLHATAASLGLSGSGVVAVFNYTTPSTAVAGATTSVAYVTFTGTSGSTLTGCTNLSAAAGATFTTTAGGAGTGSIIAYVTISSPSTDGSGAAISAPTTSRTVNGTFFSDNGNGTGSLVIDGTLGYPFVVGDVGSSITDAGGRLSTPTAITGYDSVISVEVAPAPITTGSSAGDVMTISASTTTPTDYIVVDAPTSTPSGSAPQQVGYYSQNLSGAANYNVGYWWDDGSAGTPPDSAFYGIFSPVFRVNGTTGAITSSAGATLAGALSGVTTLSMAGNLTNIATGNANLQLQHDNSIQTLTNIGLGQILFYGATDTSHTLVEGADISAAAEGTFASGTNAPTHLLFSTTSATAARVSRLLLDSVGGTHFDPTLTSGRVTAATAAIKADGSLWIAPSAYTSNQPTAAPATISAAGLGTFTGLSIVDATNIVLGTGTGTQIGTATGQKIGLHGATPVVQSTTAAAAAAGGTGATAGAWDTAAHRDTVTTLVNAMRTCLRDHGLMA